MALFQEFHKGVLPLFSLNFGIIALLPKEKEAKTDSTIQTDMSSKCKFQDLHQGYD
jgi:hypothetical protein